MQKIVLVGFIFIALLGCKKEDIGVGTAFIATNTQNSNHIGKVKSLEVLQNGSTISYNFNYDTLGKAIFQIVKKAEGVSEIITPIYDKNNVIISFSINKEIIAKRSFTNGKLIQLTTPTSTEKFTYFPTNELSNYRLERVNTRQNYAFKWSGSQLVQCVANGTEISDEIAYVLSAKENPTQSFFSELLGVFPFSIANFSPYLIEKETYLFEGKTIEYAYEFKENQLVGIKIQEQKLGGSIKSIAEIKISYF